jgi:hypothetical protein
MPDLYSQALKEAYANATPGEVILQTIELQHDTFVDGSDDPIGIRMVRDPGTQIDAINDIWGWMLTLESDASLNASESVPFVSCMFTLGLPEQNATQISDVSLEMDNVTAQISRYLETAVTVRSSMALIYREYLITDVTQPQFIMRGLSIKEIDSNIMRAKGAGQFVDLVNQAFPNKLYRPDEFPGLIQ